MRLPGGLAAGASTVRTKQLGPPPSPRSALFKPFWLRGIDDHTCLAVNSVNDDGPSVSTKRDKTAAITLIVTGEAGVSLAALPRP